MFEPISNEILNFEKIRSKRPSDTWFWLEVSFILQEVDGLKPLLRFNLHSVSERRNHTTATIACNFLENPSIFR